LGRSEAAPEPRLRYPHRTLLPELVDIIAAGQLDPARVIIEQEGLTDAIQAYRHFDEHDAGWIKVAIDPTA
jgi:threonine dehydrogenase-like Zn-dependent dehydrogenase